MTSRVALPLWLVALAVLTFVLMVVILWSVKRKRRPHMQFASEGDLPDLMRSVAGMTQGMVVGGNRLELLQNGAFWDRVFEDISAAKKTINFETFLTKKGELTRRLADALCGKAREGVEVRMMLDGTGGKHFGKTDLKKLRDAGVQVHKYHPIRPSTLGLLNNRDHRKIIVIDGKLGFVGGHCVTDNWLGEAQDKQHFRDVSARVEGPVVAQLQSAFAENWIEETGGILGGTDFFPEQEAVGETTAHAVWISPSGSPSSVKVLHYMMIRAARKRITIQNPYFLPDPDARKALLEAVKRGVEVRVMIPATTASDAPVVQHASHHHYGTLLGGGVRIFDYQQTLLHQKLIVIDGCWAAIGSANFDDRSFEVNDEICLMTYDEKVALELEAIFEHDRKLTKEVDFDSWQKRPFPHKLKDFFAFLFNEQM